MNTHPGSQVPKIWWKCQTGLLILTLTVAQVWHNNSFNAFTTTLVDFSIFLSSLLKEKDNKFNATFSSRPNSSVFVTKMANLGLSFCLFLSLIEHVFYNTNCRLYRDSNPDPQNGRLARWPLDHHHGPRFQFLLHFSFTRTSSIKLGHVNV